MMILKLLAVVFAVTAFSTILLAADNPEASLSCCDAIGAVPAGYSSNDSVTPPQNVTGVQLFENTNPKTDSAPVQKAGQGETTPTPEGVKGRK